MAPQWFKDLFNAYSSQNLDQLLLNKVRETIQREYSLPSREALDLLRQALQVISCECRSASGSRFSFPRSTHFLRRS